MSAEDYHPFVPAPGQSAIAGPTPRAHAEARMRSPRAQELFGAWAKLAAEPFRGITAEGRVQPGLFSLSPQDAPTSAMVEAVNALLGILTPAQRAALCLPVASELWRHWQNTALCRTSWTAARRGQRVGPGSRAGGVAGEPEPQRL